MLKFFYVMGKAPTGQLSCMQTGLVFKGKQLGPCCSKLMTSLVNMMLKFQMLISQIRQYFCRKN